VDWTEYAKISIRGNTQRLFRKFASSQLPSYTITCIYDTQLYDNLHVRQPSCMTNHMYDNPVCRKKVFVVKLSCCTIFVKQLRVF